MAHGFPSLRSFAHNVRHHNLSFKPLIDTHAGPPTQELPTDGLDPAHQQAETQIRQQFDTITAYSEAAWRSHPNYASNRLQEALTALEQMKSLPKMDVSDKLKNTELGRHNQAYNKFRSKAIKASEAFIDYARVTMAKWNVTSAINDVLTTGKITGLKCKGEDKSSVIKGAIDMAKGIGDRVKSETTAARTDMQHLYEQARELTEAIGPQKHSVRLNPQPTVREQKNGDGTVSLIREEPPFDARFDDAAVTQRFNNISHDLTIAKQTASLRENIRSNAKAIAEHGDGDVEQMISNLQKLESLTDHTGKPRATGLVQRLRNKRIAPARTTIIAGLHQTLDEHVTPFFGGIAPGMLQQDLAEVSRYHVALTEVYDRIDKLSFDNSNEVSELPAKFTKILSDPSKTPRLEIPNLPDFVKRNAPKNQQNLTPNESTVSLSKRPNPRSVSLGLTNPQPPIARKQITGRTASLSTPVAQTTEPVGGLSAPSSYFTGTSTQKSSMPLMAAHSRQQTQNTLPLPAYQRIPVPPIRTTAQQSTAVAPAPDTLNAQLTAPHQGSVQQQYLSMSPPTQPQRFWTMTTPARQAPIAQESTLVSPVETTLHDPFQNPQETDLAEHTTTTAESTNVSPISDHSEDLDGWNRSPAEEETQMLPGAFPQFDNQP